MPEEILDAPGAPMAFGTAPIDSDTEGAFSDEPDPAAFDIGDVVIHAWRLFTKNAGVVAASILIPFGINLLLSVPRTMADEVAKSSGEHGETFALVLATLAVSLLKMIVTLYLNLGTTRICANLAFGRPARLGMLFGEGARIPAMAAATLIVLFGLMGIAIPGVVLGYGLGSAGFGLLLVAVPGIILGLGFWFVGFALVDQDLGPIAALQESWRLTTGHKAFLFLFVVVIGVLGLVAVVLTLGLGALIVVPVFTLSQAVLYHAMVVRKGRAMAR
ncbi:MAG TPA: hypothetical protein VIG99_31420 [Myxococcaceae bacterium]|jgi:uncharacterized membrane protein